MQLSKQDFKTGNYNNSDGTQNEAMIAIRHSFVFDRKDIRSIAIQAVNAQGKALKRDYKKGNITKEAYKEIKGNLDLEWFRNRLSEDIEYEFTEPELLGYIASLGIDPKFAFPHIEGKITENDSGKFEEYDRQCKKEDGRETLQKRENSKAKYDAHRTTDEYKAPAPPGFYKDRDIRMIIEGAAKDQIADLKDMYKQAKKEGKGPEIKAKTLELLRLEMPDISPFVKDNRAKVSKRLEKLGINPAYAEKYMDMSDEGTLEAHMTPSKLKTAATLALAGPIALLYGAVKHPSIPAAFAGGAVVSGLLYLTGQNPDVESWARMAAMYLQAGLVVGGPTLSVTEAGLGVITGEKPEFKWWAELNTYSAGAFTTTMLTNPDLFYQLSQFWQ